jgi:secreted protein with Ig-like and vWFA domain
MQRREDKENKTTPQRTTYTRRGKEDGATSYKLPTQQLTARITQVIKVQKDYGESHVKKSNSGTQPRRRYEFHSTK